jgi:hypothetical protein
MGVTFWRNFGRVRSALRANVPDEEKRLGCGSQADNSDARFQDRRSTKGVEGIGLYKIFAREKFKMRL